jgi:MoxR-like ATPase
MTGRATATRGNLPAELTCFFDRRHQIQEILSVLTAARLVTLVGPGGVGKTRLALRTATDLRVGIPDGVGLVRPAGVPA